MLKLRSVGQMAFVSSVCGWMPSLTTSRCFRRPEVPAVCRRARMGTGTIEAQRSLGIGQTKINAVGLDPNEIPSRSHCDGPCICIPVSASSSGIHPLFYLCHWQQTPFKSAYCDLPPQLPLYCSLSHPVLKFIYAAAMKVGDRAGRAASVTEKEG